MTQKSDAITARGTGKLTAKVVQADARIANALDVAPQNAPRVADQVEDKLAATSAKVSDQTTRALKKAASQGAKATAKAADLTARAVERATGNAAQAATKAVATATLALQNAGLPSSALPAGFGGPPTVASLERDIAQMLGQPAAPDWMFKESDGAAWTVADLQALATTISRMSPADRQALSHTAFERVKDLGMEDGKPDYGRADFGDAGKLLGARSTIQIADIASAQGVVGDVAAHEIGHVVMGGGKWDANVVREFGKLSHWVRSGPPETLVDGYDDYHRAIDLEATDAPKNPANFVSEYARESAAEDFAESYRVYLSNPGELMAKAPEKFLFLNAQSRKYSAGEVQSLAGAAGVDLPIVMAQLARSGLRADTLDRLILGAGQAYPPAGSGAGDAVELISRKAGDPDFAATLRSDARSALGDGIWSRLTPAEQALFARPGYADSLLASAQAAAEAPADAVKDQDVATWKAFMLRLLNDPPASVEVALTKNSGTNSSRAATISTLLHEPQYWNAFSPETRALLDSDQGKAFIQEMGNDRNLLDITRLAWNTRHLAGQYVSADLAIMSRDYLKVRQYIDGLGAAEFDALTRTIARGLDPEAIRKLSDANRTVARTGQAPFAGAIPGM